MRYSNILRDSYFWRDLKSLENLSILNVRWWYVHKSSNRIYEITETLIVIIVILVAKKKDTEENKYLPYKFRLTENKTEESNVFNCRHESNLVMLVNNLIMVDYLINLLILELNNLT